MTAYNGQSDPRLQAIAEAERERFRTGNGQGNGHARLNEDEPLLCEQLCRSRSILFRLVRGLTATFCCLAMQR